jgi:hypothetical protein
LLQTRHPVHPMATQLAEWLGEHNPTFRSFVTNPAAKRLHELSRLRGQAQHDSVSEAEARQVYEDATRLFEALLSDDSSRHKR